MEAYTVQPLYGPVRDRALAALHGPVAPGGTLLVIARATNDQEPARDPAQMPWALTRRELDLAGGPLRQVAVEQFFDDEDPPKLRWRAEFHREGALRRMVLPGCGYGNARGRRNERHVEMRTSGTSRHASGRSH